MKTLQEIVAYTDKYDIRNLAIYYTDLYGNTFPNTTQMDRYFTYIQDYISTYGTNEEQRRLYRYRPDLLSQKIYGSPLFDWAIMKMNNVESASRFYVHSRIKLIEPITMQNILVNLASKDVDMIKMNRVENGL